MKLLKFDELVLPNNGRVCNHLSKLVLDNDYDTNVGGFLQSTCLNMDGLTHLKLRDFGMRATNNRFPTDAFLQLLSKVPSVQFLHLNGVFVAPIDPSRVDEFVRALPNLRGFWPRSSPNINQQMISLRMRSPKPLNFLCCNVIPLPGANYEHLQEVFFCPEAAPHILATAKSLKRIWFRCRLESDLSILKDCIHKIFAEQTSLELLQVYIHGNHTDSVLNAISKGVFHITGESRKRVVILLDIVEGQNAAVNVVDRLFNINSVLNELHASNIKDYALRVTKCHEQSAVDAAVKRASMKFEQLNGKRFDMEVKTGRYCFKKKGSNCGFDRQWEQSMICNMIDW